MRGLLPALLLTFATAASGDELTCRALTEFAESANETTLGLGPAKCSRSLVLGAGPSFDCYWSYGFRSSEAEKAFAELQSLILNCTACCKEADGADVNHPDSFDQLTAEFGVHELSLSWKDEGALEQTLIFLRASQP